METFAPLKEHTHTIILLHGRDSTAKDFASEFFESQTSGLQTLPELFPTVKWVFPTAGLFRSKRFDCELSQWFDMYTTENPHEREDEQDLSPSISRIQELVAQEAAIIGHENVILGGISQGCAVAIHAFLKGQKKIRGFIGLCSWLPRRQEIKLLDSTNQAITTPVLLCHAHDDDVINITFGKELQDILSGIGMGVRWCEYTDGGHWVNEPQGVDDMVAFLKEIGLP